MRRARRLILGLTTVCAIGVAAASIGVAGVGTGSAVDGSGAGSAQGARSDAHVLAELRTVVASSSRLAGHEPAAPGSTPSCADALVPPPAQFPDGHHGLGVPFVASLTAGEILSGFHLNWVPPSTPKAPHPASPWALRLTGISGWITGLLEVPSLAAVVDPATGVQFCDDTGLVPPALPRLQFDLVNDNKVRDNTQNFDPTYKAGAYAPDFFSLRATGAPALQVSAVDADGALELSGTTPVRTTVSVWFNNGTQSKPKFVLAQTCQQFPGRTSINVGTAPQPAPAGAPPGSTLQFTPAPLTGGLPRVGNSAPASATLVGDDFPIGAFNVARRTGCFFGLALNGALSGYGITGLSQDQCSPLGVPGTASCPYVASPPGWSQVTIKASITYLGVPYGVPTGFGF